MESVPVIRERCASAGTRLWPAWRPHTVALLGMGLALIGTGSCSIAILPGHELRSAEALLEEAYIRARAFEFRLPAASYAAVRAELQL